VSHRQAESLWQEGEGGGRQAASHPPMPTVQQVGMGRQRQRQWRCLPRVLQSRFRALSHLFPSGRPILQVGQGVGVVVEVR